MLDVRCAILGEVRELGGKGRHRFGEAMRRAGRLRWESRLEKL